MRKNPLTSMWMGAKGFGVGSSAGGVRPSPKNPFIPPPRGPKGRGEGDEGGRGSRTLFFDRGFSEAGVIRSHFVLNWNELTPVIKERAN